MDDQTEREAVDFAALGLRSELVDVLARLGYEEATPIQRESIPHLLAGRDLLGQAATGTGKTAAFALPVLERVAGGRAGAPAALVLVPTRELAMQVSEAMYRYGQALGARVVPIYGGQPIGRQIGALERGAHVVVATPGRAIDHLQRGTLPLDAIRTVVLDEADEMLDMGFADELEAILDAVPAERQTVLFSATMPPRIDAIARRHLRDPVRVLIARDADRPGTSAPVRQRVHVVARAHKPAALGRILDVEAPTAAIVFCRTRSEVDQLTETLNGRGYRAEALHGGMDQEQRDRVMGRLRSGTSELLIATDVAARGLDIDVLTHVVNYDVPSAPEAYVHRIGRVGRAGREGVAITLAEPRERRLVENIERYTGQRIDVAAVPSVAELRARLIEHTARTVRDAVAAGDLDRYRELLDALALDAGVEAVALAALKLVHEADGGTDDDVEIPDLSAPRPERDRSRRERAADRERGAGGPRAGGQRRLSDERPTGKIHVNLGTAAGVRPGDLVGAIANETSLSGRDIGAIKVGERFSVVELPAEAVDEVIAALGRTTIKGRRPAVRRFRDERHESRRR